ncbi:hypothetical protein B0H17DRAFT_77889 [Mycena rosella]|uniref:Uncharacterized protein n=1 Tax=Mycena rosella TaxID=1033263 RepID=A0AAD7D527_MYCRO|nr:hypothetical protein B0H17DRAFT_77889 [Mycena rosella]
MGELGLSSRNWLVIDKTGLDTATCLVCEQSYATDAGGGQTAEFRACRVPYEEAWITIANLDISHLPFESFVDEDAGEQVDGTWKWKRILIDPPREVVTKREKALQELQDGGHVD